MFKNIGKKIKTLAKVLFWIEVISFGICGITAIGTGIYMMAGRYKGVTMSGIGTILGGIAIIGLGFLLAWVGQFLLYGFGELVDKTASIEKMMAEKGGCKAMNPPPFPGSFRPESTAQPYPGSFRPEPTAEPIAPSEPSAEPEAPANPDHQGEN